MHFVCSICKADYAIETRDYRCRCGGPFQLAWTPRPFPIFSLHERGPSIWRYRESLPIEKESSIVSLGEGSTPLISFRHPRCPSIEAKLDYLCPTGSYKDRGTTVLISMLKVIGMKKCIADSSGNAGASMAAYTARAGIGCRIFCPAYTSEGKLVQIKAYGAELARIPGTRAETAAAVQQEAREVYYSSHNWNPFFIEGVKTVAFEISEQLGWKVPDAVICPVGYGGIYLGLYRGFSELLNQGAVDRLPKLFGVQSEFVSPIYDAFCRGAVEVNEALSKKSIAEGIACIKPIRGKEILEIARLTNGGFEVVSEAQIVEGWRELCQQGIYVEPTSAVVVKAVDRLLEKKAISSDDHIVIVLTGIGLKSTETLGEYLTEAV